MSLKDGFCQGNSSYFYTLNNTTRPECCGWDDGSELNIVPSATSDSIASMRLAPPAGKASRIILLEQYYQPQYDHITAYVLVTNFAGDQQSLRHMCISLDRSGSVATGAINIYVSNGIKIGGAAGPQPDDGSGTGTGHP